MRILSLHLGNIKSYGEPTEIDFTAGLNAVCGSNGSGKTTVLEAIGYVLFDYLPYNRDAFVREGEKSGTIRLRLLAGDGREYEIVRKVGSGAHYFVVDVETNTRLADRALNVLEWVRTEALGIEGNVDLSMLFKNAVGVPQGTMTSDFLGAASTRKTIFDPLLRVEEYRDAFEELRETMSYLKDRTAAVDTEVAGLETETSKIPELQDARSELQTKVDAGAARVSRLQVDLEELERRRRELDAVENELRSLRERVQGAEYDVRRFGDALRHAEEQLESARAAHRAIVAAEPGYHLHVAAVDRLKELDRRRSDRDGLRASLAKTKGQLDGTRRQIERLTGDLKAAGEAAAAADALRGDVVRQEDLQRERHELSGLLRTAGELETRVTGVQREMAALERASAERERRIADARSARDESAQLAATRDRLRELGAEMARLDPIRRQLEEVAAEGKALKEQGRKLAAESHRREELVRRREALLPQAETLDGLRTRRQELGEERAQVTAAIEYQSVARRNLQERQCPLLEMQCPVVSADVAVLRRFDSRAGELDSRRRLIEESLEPLAAEIAAAEAAADECQRLQVQIAGLDAGEARWIEVRKSLEECVTRHNELSAQLSREAELRTALNAAVTEERRLQGASDLAQQLDPLLAGQAEDVKRLEGQRAQLTEVREQQSTMQTFAERVRAIDDELRELGDPRARHGELAGIAGRRASIEALLQHEESRYAADDETFRELQEKLQPFDTLDDEIAEQQEIESTHRPAYEAYIENKSEAAQIGERERLVTEAGGALKAAREAETSLRRVCEETASRYDGQLHEELKTECRTVGETLASERRGLEHLSLDLARAERELGRLEALRKKLLDRQAERDELGRVTRAITFIRDTIKSAGPAVTETLLAHISQGANDIFSEIMDDHTVELRWDRDYEVLAQRGPEVRKFSQLSGGEQMSAALAVRLALLKEMTEVNFAFFDEPTQNMDGERRTNLADQIRQVRGFEQLIVISHDDTFEHHTDNLIRLQKVHEETHLEAS